MENKKNKNYTNNQCLHFWSAKKLPLILGGTVRFAKNGAACQNRTDHLRFTKPLLYQMS